MTVKESLALPCFKDAKLLTKKVNTTKKVVSGISVLENTEKLDVQKTQFEKDELVLSSFFVSWDVKIQKKMIKEFAEVRIAALLVTASPGEEIASGILSFAEMLGVPIYDLKGKSSKDYANMIYEVTRKLKDDESFENRLITNTIFHLLDFEKHTNFQAAVRQAAIKNNFQLILLSEDFNPIFTVETQHNATIEDAIKLAIERGKEIEKSGIYTMIDVNGVLTYWGPVSIGGKKQYMFIVDNEESYSAAEITKLAEILELAMGMWKYTPERDLNGEFVKAMRRGNITLAYSLKEEAGFADYKVAGVFTVSGDNKEKYNKFFAHFEEQTDLKIIRTVDEEETAGIILTKEDRMKAGAENILLEMFENSGREYIYHVSGLENPESAVAGFKMINETSGFAGYVFPKKKIFSKFEMAVVSNCIEISMQGGAVKQNYLNLVASLRLSKELKDRQLFETMTTYMLDAALNIPDTAKLLDVHHNTVQYRIKRMRDILGVDITDGRVSPSLMIAVALSRMENVLKGFK